MRNEKFSSDEEETIRDGFFEGGRGRQDFYLRLIVGTPIYFQEELVEKYHLTAVSKSCQETGSKLSVQPKEQKVCFVVEVVFYNA